jgi:hypothetical protein
LCAELIKKEDLVLADGEKAKENAETVRISLTLSNLPIHASIVIAI